MGESLATQFLSADWLGRTCWPHLGAARGGSAQVFEDGLLWPHFAAVAQVSAGATGNRHRDCPVCVGPAQAAPKWGQEHRHSHADLETACPTCGYLMWVRYSEVVAQTAVICPCCYTHIWLVDDTGSAQNAGDAIEQQITQALKGLFR